MTAVDRAREQVARMDDAADRCTWGGGRDALRDYAAAIMDAGRTVPELVTQIDRLQAEISQLRRHAVAEYGNGFRDAAAYVNGALLSAVAGGEEDVTRVLARVEHGLRQQAQQVSAQLEGDAQAPAAAPPPPVPVAAGGGCDG